MSKTLAIIPARGGSKGVPRKNLTPLLGKPLVVHSIIHATRTKEVTHTVVSTDDDEIAAVSKTHGADVVLRPPELSGDTASSESALLHALDMVEQKDGFVPDTVVFLQATSPIRKADDIARALNMFECEGLDSLFSAFRLEGFLWRCSNDELRSVSYDFTKRALRQEREQDYIENGSIYIFRPWVLRELNNRLGGKMGVYEMDFFSSLQIDEPEDIKVIETLMEMKRS